MYDNGIKAKVVRLRERGLTYAEILKVTEVKIPKSTLTSWCKNIRLSSGYYQKLAKINKVNLKIARDKAVRANKRKMNLFLNGLWQKNIII